MSSEEIERAIGKEEVLGLAGSFSNPDRLREAAVKMKELGYSRYEALSPFPLHGLDEELGESRSRVSYIAGFAALIGGSSLLYLIWWINVKAYPIILSGKPFFSYQAFFPPIFAICILFAAFGSLFGYFALGGIKYHHPHFFSQLVSTASDDGFVLVVDSSDPRFDLNQLTALFKDLGAERIEAIVKGESNNRELKSTRP